MAVRRRKPGRRSILNEPGTMEAIRSALALGVSKRETAAAIGVSEQTWYNWQNRGKLICEMLGDSETSAILSMEELRYLAERLDVNLLTLEGSGKNGRPLKTDIVRRVDETGRKYKAFFEQLEGHKERQRIQLLGSLDRLVKGGRVIVDVDSEGKVRRRGVRKKTVITDRKLKTVALEDGSEVEAWVTVGERLIEEESELPPDRQAVVKMLEFNDPSRFSNVKARDHTAQGSPEDKATEVATAVRAILGTVPQPKQLVAAQSDVSGLLAEIQGLSDEEVEQQLAALGC